VNIRQRRSEKKIPLRVRTPAFVILRVLDDCPRVVGPAGSGGGGSPSDELNGGEPMNGPYPAAMDGNAMDLRRAGVESAEPLA